MNQDHEDSLVPLEHKVRPEVRESREKLEILDQWVSQVSVDQMDCLENLDSMEDLDLQVHQERLVSPDQRVPEVFQDFQVIQD